MITPGEGSVLSSPIHLAAEVQLEPGDYIRVSLTNGSNIPISRQLLRVSQSDDHHTLFERDIPFEIPTETAKALLTISILDSYHRPRSLRSVPLTLSHIGTVNNEPQDNPEPWLTIVEPEPQAIISGGEISLQGTVIPPMETPVIFELITDTGGIIGYALLAVKEPGDKIDFDLQLSYSFITTARDVRLIVRQMTDDHITNAILDSIPLTVMP